ncbi:MAG: hypothetical protein MMC23_006076 [Stictis urceolatum]|nr:hypothetical protein [Stictis urceolata]
MIHIRHLKSPPLSPVQAETVTTPPSQQPPASPSWYQTLAHSASQLRYFLHTIHLFILSDLRTMLLPFTIFGFLSTLSGSSLLSISTDTPPTFTTILPRLPSLLLFLHPQILILSISNQRSPSSLTEDLINKPWRPIVSNRISASRARQILLLLVPATVCISAYQGVLAEGLACLVGCWFYNDLGGADEHFVVRGLVNGVAYLAYGSAVVKIAAEVGGGVGFELRGEFWEWLGLICLAVGTTIQVQDLKDRVGDAARGRSTMPVVLGDGWTRVSVCAGALLWSVVCPAYWASEWWVRVAVLAAGAVLSGRIVLWREAKADKMSFVWWSWWIVGLFLLPLLASGQYS